MLGLPSPIFARAGNFGRRFLVPSLYLESAAHHSAADRSHCSRYSQSDRSGCEDCRSSRRTSGAAGIVRPGRSGNATTTPPVKATPTIPIALPVPTAIAVATPTIPVARAVEPEVRRAQPVRPEELAAAQAGNVAAEANAPNLVDIKPLKRTYMRVTIDDDPTKPAFERWVSPSDGTVEFRGHRFSVTVLDRDAVQIRKNGKIVSNSDTDLRITAQ